MAIIVNTNVTALKTQRNLNNATNSLNTSLERMSTGLKINKAADDAANLYVATGLNTQIRGSKVALNNVATGTNVLQIMEGDMDVILDNLNRVRDLAVQAGNSVYSEDAMKAMKQETVARLDEIDRIALASNFNGLALLSDNISYTTEAGSVSSEQKNGKAIMTDGLRLQIAANADEKANAIKLGTGSGELFNTKVNSVELGKKAEKSGKNPVMDENKGLRENVDAAFKSASAAAQYIKVIDQAINDISNKKSTIGATMNRLSTAESSLTTTIENNTAAKSTIMDADIAEESANYTKAQILQQTSASLLVQANRLPQIALNLIQ